MSEKHADVDSRSFQDLVECDLQIGSLSAPVCNFRNL